MPLKNLLLDDLTRFSTDPTAVASEESIRLLIDIYKKYRKLKNPALVHSDQIPNVLYRIHKQKRPAHTQLIVEFSSRSLIKQRSHGTEGYNIHYMAMDVFCNANGDLTAFIADHYFGEKYDFPTAFQEIRLPILFVVAGGSPYQTGRTHCPIFSLQHLLLTANDTALHARVHTIAKAITDQSGLTLSWLAGNTCVDEDTIYLAIKGNDLVYSIFNVNKASKPHTGSIPLAKLNPDFTPNVTIEELRNCLPKIVRETARRGHTSKAINIPWFSLEPRYNVYPQSFTQLNNYVEYVARQSPPPSTGSTPGHIVRPAIPALSDARFDIHVSKGLVCDEDNKVKNRGIEHLALDYAQLASISLDYEDYTEAELINICYNERYTFVAEVINSGREISQDLGNDVTIDPLLEFVFSNQFILNCFLLKNYSSQSTQDVDTVKRDFAEYLSYPSLIHLIITNCIDVNMLVEKLTCIDINDCTGFEERFINPAKLKLVIDNKSILDNLVDQWQPQSGLSIDSATIIELLCPEVASTLLEIKPVRRLYLSGDIDHQTLLSISLEQLTLLNPLKDCSLAKMTRSELLDHINNHLLTGSPVSIANGALTPNHYSQKFDLKFTQRFFSPCEPQKQANDPHTSPENIVG